MNANGLYSGVEGYVIPGTNSGVGGGVANGVYSNEGKMINQFLLNVYPGAEVAYSLRKLRSTYSGSAIRVRRSSDNLEQDIGFDRNGNLNEVQLRGFVGSSDGFVSVWYDQSGTINATQSTTANQPRIINAGVVDRVNGRIVIRATSSQFLSTASTIQAFGNNFTTFILLSRTGTGDDAILLSSGVNYMYLHYTTTVFIGDAQVTGVSLGSSQTLITLRRSNSPTNISSVYRNNIFQNSTTNISSNAGFNQIPSSAFRSSTVFINELVVYYSDKINDILAINDNINRYWRIY